MILELKVRLINHETVFKQNMNIPGLRRQINTFILYASSVYMGVFKSVLITEAVQPYILIETVILTGLATQVRIPVYLSLVSLNVILDR